MMTQAVLLAALCCSLTSAFSPLWQQRTVPPISQQIFRSWSVRRISDPLPSSALLQTEVEDAPAEEADTSAAVSETAPETAPEGDGMVRREFPSYEFVVHFYIPSVFCGPLIGAGGSVIREIREATGARVEFAGGGPAPIRLLQVAGEYEVVLATIERLFRTIEQAVRTSERLIEKGWDVTRPFSVHLFFPTPQFGALMGLAGETQRRIRTESGARTMLVPLQDEEGRGPRLIYLGNDIQCERKMIIKGDVDNVRQAMLMSVKALTDSAQQFPLRAKAEYLGKRKLATLQEILEKASQTRRIFGSPGGGRGGYGSNQQGAYGGGASSQGASESDTIEV